MIDTMMQWRPLSAFGDSQGWWKQGAGGTAAPHYYVPTQIFTPSAIPDSTLASTICCCLNFQQELKKDGSPRPKLVSPKDIAGETKIYH